MTSRRIVAAARAQLSNPLLRSGYSLIANAGLTSALGVAFWIVAARFYPPSTVGRDGALIAAMITISVICQLNLANAIPRFLSQVANPARTLGKAYGASAALAVVIASVFVLIVPYIDPELAFVHGEPLLALGFVVATVLWGVFALEDAALLSLRRAPWVPVANATYGALKLALLPALLVVGGTTGSGIFWSWVIPLALLIVPVNLLIFRRAIPGHNRDVVSRTSPLSQGRRPLIRFLAQDYAASTMALIGFAGLPLLVLALLGSRANGFFYIAFTIALALELVLYSAGLSMVAETAYDERQLVAHLRSVIRRFVPIVLLGSLVMIVAAPLVLLPFGPEYQEEASALMRLLGMAVVFRCIIYLFQAVARGLRNGRALLLVDGSLLALTAALVVPLGSRFGLTGVGVAWLTANGVVALAILPWLARFLRGSEVRARTSREPGRQTPAPVPALAAAEPSAHDDGAPDARARARTVRQPSTPVLVAACAGCVGTLVLVGSGSLPSLAALALFTVFALAPGAALLPLLGGRDDVLRAGPIVGVSLGISVVLVQSMIWLDVWHPRETALLLAGACLPAVGLHLVRGLRRPAAADGP